MKGHTEWVPQAIIDLAPAYFEAKGLEFFKGQDDFDHFEGTKQLKCGHYNYKLLRYRGFPRQKVQLYLPQEMEDLSEILKGIQTIVHHLGLPAGKISWQRGSRLPF